MGSPARICLQSLLKLVNWILGVVGMGMILYSLWMMRIWCKQMAGFCTGPTPPWFIYSFLGLGIILCLITCSGHIAAETANGHCLSCYSTFIFLVVMLEAAVTADIFLNDSWEEDFPDDPTGRFDELKNFVKSNFEICKWIGLAIVSAQALSIFLASIVRALGPDRGCQYDSDDEDDYAPVRLPLLVNQAQHPAYGTGVAADPRVVLKNDSWNLRINDR